jgi:hypothetical protein
MDFFTTLRNGIRAGLLTLILFGGALSAAPGQRAMAEQQANSLATTVYFPLTSANSPYLSPFAFESGRKLTSGTTILTRGIELGTSWTRSNNRISWRQLQPNEGDVIRWELLESFENELRQLKAAGIRSVVIVDDYPAWAVQERLSGDDPPKLSLCAPLKEDKLDDFAAFVREIVKKYKTSQFNVHDWELGNEPDVDPSLVLADSGFGCWGDIQDPYYGGEYYGEMIKVVSQAIKAEDKRAVVWLGGLLLAAPEPTDPVAFGHPELFFQGVLQAGAADYFDIVTYHWYPSYTGSNIDHDLNIPNGKWNSWGGGTLGKALFLRQTMQAYGVDKPLVLNETAMGCPDNWPRCAPPPPAFYLAQGDYLVRSFTRGLSGGIAGFAWYTLNGPGWRSTGLLDVDDNIMPAYTAYQQFTARMKQAWYIGPAGYGAGFEAYEFARVGSRLHVVWAREETTAGTISIPASQFIEAWTRDGDNILPVYNGANAELWVGFSPIYVILTP